MRCATRHDPVQVPLFAWSIFVTSWLILRVPACSWPVRSRLMLWTANYCFLRSSDPAGGGDPVLYQANILWFFGHPESHTIIIHARLRHQSPTLSLHSRASRIFGYLANGLGRFSRLVVLGFVVWAPPHVTLRGHVAEPAATSCLPRWLDCGYRTGVKVSAGSATHVGRPVEFKTPMPLGVRLPVPVTVGGVTGLLPVPRLLGWNRYTMTATMWLHNFHYVMRWALLFAIFAGIYFYLAKMSGSDVP